MSYTALARRYRSRSFDEVVGQEEIARTLQRAVEQGRVAHAYLFVGTRGVGKTSTARILAKALNCPDDEPAEVAEAIMQGRDTDVVEIDAASNRGVDEARSLIANASIRPLRGRYKVYIIDEVHMLTREAANALLKTMEEPPEHVKFILCTTEAHKVPATIQSRCQRFDFRAIPARKIAQRLREVLDLEGVEAEEEVVLRVAEMGAGSMRDALSLLDRLLGAREEGQRLTLQGLRDLLGLAPDELVGELLEACVEADAARALRLGRELLALGLDVEQALHALAQELRDVMTLALAPDDEELTPRAGERRRRALALAQRLEPQEAAHMIALCDAAALRARSSAVAEALFDVAMVRLASTGRLAQAAALLQGEGAARGSPRKKVPEAAQPALRVEPDAAAPPLRPEPRSAPNDAPTATQRHSEPAPVEGEGVSADQWRSLQRHAAQSASPALAALVESLRFVASDGASLTLGVESAKRPLAQSRSAQLQALLRDVLGAAPTLRFVDLETTARKQSATAWVDVEKDPLVKAAIEVFDARIVRVVKTADRND